MGIPSLASEIWKIDGCVIDVSIPELVKKYEKNVIVVDGFQFYGLYLYPRFDWICGAFRELVQEICKFVESFNRIGIKLVFYFAEGNLDEGHDTCGTVTWMKRHSAFIEYSQKIFKNISSLYRIKQDRTYYHTPLNALHVVFFALRHICKCDVRIIYPGDRNDAVAYYSRSNDCLAILAQDTCYMFYTGIPRYLSLKNLNLTKMTTVQYSSEALAKHKKLEGCLYPFFLENSLTSAQTETLIKIIKKLEVCESVDIAKQKIKDCLKGNKFEQIFELEDTNVEDTSELDIHFLLIEILRYNYGCDYLTVHGPLTKWELIKLRAQELYQSGQMSSRILHILFRKKFFNDCILEDFTEFPPSSIVYQALRSKLYGILLQEEPICDVNIADDSKSDTSSTESSDEELVPGARHIWERKLYGIPCIVKPSNNSIVLEYVMTEKGCRGTPVPVIRPQLDCTSHPGLLSLWDFSAEPSINQADKWQLFASCVSHHLAWHQLCSLPSTLVLPTVVLHYLFVVVPLQFQDTSWIFMQTWEVEVFLAQAVMLSKMSTDTLSQIVIKNINPRVVKLMSIFVYGCHNMRLLVEACGYPISKYDISLYHFFDGKLLHSFYEKCEWRRNAKDLCDNKESFEIFQQMKQIVVSRNK